MGRDAQDVNDELGSLVEAWCDRRALRNLATLLPAYTSNNGLTDGWSELLQALYTVRAARGLPGDEERMVEQLVARVEAIVHRS